MRRSVEVMPVLFHSFGSYAQVPREWNGAPRDLGAVLDLRGKPMFGKSS
jgi:hypothetical protein